MKDPCDHYTYDLIGGTQKKPGRKPLGERAMTVAERKRRSRELRRNRLQELSVTVELSRDAQKSLDKMIEWWGVSKKEAINRALTIACQSQTGRTGTLFGFDPPPPPAAKPPRRKPQP
ncbi:ribbon-helix-helix domain-containing protein [Chromobacterium vaccinii]|uniref:ribbon-helix-helix domain-containing protein n=1 Tax=Chromobacterium vaccinii TaxID=1108595 RepID=UPI003C78CB02